MSGLVQVINSAPALMASVAIHFPSVQYGDLVPELALLVGALVAMVSSALARTKYISFPYTGIGIVTVVLAGVWSYHLSTIVASSGPKAIVAGAMAVDGFSTFLMVLIAVSLLLVILLAEAFIYEVGSRGPDFVALLLLSGSGAMFMASAEDLLVLFVGLEILSIALYVLVAYCAQVTLSREAAFKYFILGGFSSAILLYGIALTYGATGTTNIGQIALFLSQNTLTSNGVLLGGMALIIVGLGFKIAAVPFQLWTPDVYQGAPTTVTGYMASVAKAGGFAGLLRVLYVSFQTVRIDWRPVILVMCVLTLFTGSILALVQRDVKRLLAYSSINHAGFILIGLYVATQSSLGDSLYYVFAYSIMAIGSFGCVSIIGHLKGSTEGPLDIDSLRGLAREHPRLAVVFAILLVAQSGAPFTIGFLAKFSVVSAAALGQHYELAVLAMLSAVIAVYFYLRVVFAMYRPPLTADTEGESGLTLTDDSGDVMIEEDGELDQGDLLTVTRSRTIPVAASLSVGLALAMTIGFGIVANPLISFASSAIPLH